MCCFACVFSPALLHSNGTWRLQGQHVLVVRGCRAMLLNAAAATSTRSLPAALVGTVAATIWEFRSGHMQWLGSSERGRGCVRGSQSSVAVHTAASIVRGSLSAQQHAPLRPPMQQDCTHWPHLLVWRHAKLLITTSSPPLSLQPPLLLSACSKVDKLAAQLLVPYLGWITFAGVRAAPCTRWAPRAEGSPCLDLDASVAAHPLSWMLVPLAHACRSACS